MLVYEIVLDGELGVLEDAGAVAIDMGLAGGYCPTWARITPPGREALEPETTIRRLLVERHSREAASTAYASTCSPGEVSFTQDRPTKTKPSPA